MSCTNESFINHVKDKLIFGEKLQFHGFINLRTSLRRPRLPDRTIPLVGQGP